MDSLLANEKKELWDSRIVLYPNPILRVRAHPVELFDQKLRSLVTEMLLIIQKEDAAGLAAPQIGVRQAIIVYRVDDEEGCLINPRVVKKEGKSERVEGCLSLPGLSVKVKRAEKIQVEGISPLGEEISIEAADTLSHVIQHEVEHLQGLTILNHISKLKRDLVTKKMEGLKKKYDHYKENDSHYKEYGSGN